MQTINQRFIVALAVFGFLIVSLPSPSNASTVVLTATEDSGVQDGVNTLDPFGFLYSELNTGGHDIWLSVLKFDLSSIAGMTVNSATLELTTFFNHNTPSFAHNIYSSSDDSWTEGTITGTNRPLDSTLALLDSTNIDGTSQAYTWNVLSGVTGTDGLAGANDDLTLLLRPDLSLLATGVGFGPHIFSSESGSGFPTLTLDVTLNPVPVPAAIWLFGTALIGLVGFGKRKAGITA